jgi:monomeric sarcosine oxidase
MGTAAAWALAKRGVRSVVFEQFEHVHSFGSHGGKTRIIRHAYAEGPEYVPFVAAAEELWHQLESTTGQRIHYRTGGLDLAAPGFSHAGAARRSAERYHFPHEWLNGHEVNRRWPVWRLPDDWQACYSPQTGFLDVTPALRSLRSAAEREGATFETGRAVRGWHPDGSGVVVEAQDETIAADRVVVTAGAWNGGLLADLHLPLEVRRKVVFWLVVSDPSAFEPDRFPIFIAEWAGGEMYGLPSFGAPGLKIGNHSGGQTTDPNAVDRVVRSTELQDVLPFAELALPSVTSTILESTVCLYTVTPDENFIVDRHPTQPNVVFAAGFSGHGFKFAPAIGEHLADLTLDPTAKPLDLFAQRRFGLEGNQT